MEKRIIKDLKQELIEDFVCDLEELINKIPLEVRKEDIKKIVREMYELKEKWKKEV